MAKAYYLKEGESTIIYPIAHADATYYDDQMTVAEKIDFLEDKINNGIVLSTQGGTEIGSLWLQV